MYIEDRPVGEALMRDVLDWAKKRDREEQYNWGDSGDCACARYAKEKGRFREWSTRSLDSAWVELSEAALPITALVDGYPVATMGGFASRLEKALA